MTLPPTVTTAEWGRIHVDGLGWFKDVKLWPGGAREWDWTETGTHHSPGVQSADVAELLDHGVRIVVIGTGMQGALGVDDGTSAALDAAGVTLVAVRTAEAVTRYNELARTEAVGGLLHSTC